MLLQRIEALDAVLHLHANELGGDLTAYRNHAYRVVNLCAVLSPRAAAQLDKVVVAAAFHDLASGPTVPSTISRLQACSRAITSRGPEARNGRRRFGR